MKLNERCMNHYTFIREEVVLSMLSYLDSVAFWAILVHVVQPGWMGWGSCILIFEFDDI